MVSQMALMKKVMNNLAVTPDVYVPVLLAMISILTAGKRQKQKLSMFYFMLFGIFAVAAWDSAITNRVFEWGWMGPLLRIEFWTRLCATITVLAVGLYRQIREKAVC